MRISDWSSDVCSSDLDQVGYDGARGGAIACARAFEEQPPDEIALGDDRIERARDMRERMIERNEVRMDALEQSGAVRLGDAHQPDAIAERRGLGDIGGDHLTNTGDPDFIDGRLTAERQAGEEDRKSVV